MPTVQEQLEAERSTVGMLETVTTQMGVDLLKHARQLSIQMANAGAQTGETNDLFTRLRIIGQELKDLKRETAEQVLAAMPPESGPAVDLGEENREIRRVMREPEPEGDDEGKKREALRGREEREVLRVREERESAKKG